MKHRNFYKTCYFIIWVISNERTLAQKLCHDNDLIHKNHYSQYFAKYDVMIRIIRRILSRIFYWYLFEVQEFGVLTLRALFLLSTFFVYGRLYVFFFLLIFGIGVYIRCSLRVCLVKGQGWKGHERMIKKKKLHIPKVLLGFMFSNNLSIPCWLNNKNLEQLILIDVREKSIYGRNLSRHS